jgi:uncharacterized phage-associated protein
MEFRFDVEKTIQAIAALLHFHETQEMSYVRLLKLLYMADRETLRESGFPITGDRVAAMPHGPVLSHTYDLIKGEHPAWARWSMFLGKKGYRLTLLSDPGNGALSRYEISKLRDITERYAGHDEWAMIDLTHTLTEWQQNYQSSRWISVSDILDAVGRGDDKVEMLKDAADQVVYDRIFAASTR